MKLGEFIKQLRKEKGLSAREVARRAGISQAYLSQLETGKNEHPSNEVANQIAIALDTDYMTLWSLIGGKYAFDETDRTLALTAYLAIGDFTSLTDHGQPKYNLEKLLAEDTLLTYNGRPISNEEKEKILALVIRMLQQEDIFKNQEGVWDIWDDSEE